MFILFGTRRTRQNLGRIAHGCARCQQHAWFNYMREKSHFTLFFIPLIPLSTTTTAICTACGFHQVVPEAAANHALAAARTQAAPQLQQYRG